MYAIRYPSSARGKIVRRRLILVSDRPTRPGRLTSQANPTSAARSPRYRCSSSPQPAIPVLDRHPMAYIPLAGSRCVQRGSSSGKAVSSDWRGQVEASAIGFQDGLWLAGASLEDTLRHVESPRHDVVLLRECSQEESNPRTANTKYQQSLTKSFPLCRSYIPKYPSTNMNKLQGHDLGCSGKPGHFRYKVLVDSVHECPSLYTGGTRFLSWVAGGRKARVRQWHVAPTHLG